MNSRLSGWFEWVGVAGLLLMMLVTGIDVVGAKLFTWRLLGAIDIVMLSQLLAISFGAACTLIAERHVRVEFFVPRLPVLAQTVIDTFIYFICAVLFVLIIWRLTVLGFSFQATGEATATIYIPLSYFTYGVAVACIPVCIVYVASLVNAIYRVAGR